MATSKSNAAAKGRARSGKNSKKVTWRQKDWWRLHYVPVVFVAMFALIGGYLIYHTFAASAQVQLKMTFSSKTTDTNLCLDDWSLGTANHNPIKTYACSSSDNAQKWTLVSANGGFQIKNTYANVCVDDPGDAVGTNASNRKYLIAWQCNTADKAQIWNWYGGSTYGQIKNRFNNGCINSPGSSRSAGTQLIVYPCAGSGPTFFAEVGVPTNNGACASLSASQSASVTNAKNAAHCELSKYGWNNDTQFSCLDHIFYNESKWVYNAGSIYAPYGIPQANPGTKMVSAGSDWRTDATTQIKWALGYIKDEYHTPCGAWSFWQGHHGY